MQEGLRTRALWSRSCLGTGWSQLHWRDPTIDRWFSIQTTRPNRAARAIEIFGLAMGHSRVHSSCYPSKGDGDAGTESHSPWFTNLIAGLHFLSFDDCSKWR